MREWLEVNPEGTSETGIGEEARDEVESLIQDLRNGIDNIRANAAWTIGDMMDEETAKPLIIALEAIIALGELGDERAVKPLIQALECEMWVIRKAAAEALGRLRKGMAVKPLTRALGDENRWVREAVVRALEELDGGRAVGRLSRALKSRDEEPLGVTRRTGNSGITHDSDEKPAGLWGPEPRSQIRWIIHALRGCGMESPCRRC